MSHESRDVVLEVGIDAAPERVFALLTDPAHMKAWFAELVKADPHPGGLFRISDADGISIEGTYLEVVANNKVVFTWGGVERLGPGQSTVEFLLEPDGEGALLRLRHYRLPVALSFQLVEASAASHIRRRTTRHCHAPFSQESRRRRLLRRARTPRFVSTSSVLRW